MRVMLDSNIFDRLERDDEAVSELENRRDVRLVISEIQLQQLSAIPDEGRRARYLELASRLCATVSAAAVKPGQSVQPQDRHEPDRHEPDRMIAAAASARCDLLVTDDAGLLEYARKTNVRVMDWTMFVRRIIFDRR